MHPRRSLQEFALAFAARPVIAADHAKGEVFRSQPPLPTLPGRVEGTKAAGVYAPMDDMNLRVITEDRWPCPSFRFGGVRFIDALAQDLGHKMRHGDERITLPQQKTAAGPRTGALGHVAGQNHFGSATRNPRGEHRRPEVAPVMAMDDLDAFAADQLCHAQDEAHLDRKS